MGDSAAVARLLARHLQPSTTQADLELLAGAESDTEAARRMQEAKSQLFVEIRQKASSSLTVPPSTQRDSHPCRVQPSNSSFRHNPLFPNNLESLVSTEVAACNRATMWICDLKQRRPKPQPIAGRD